MITNKSNNRLVLNLDFARFAFTNKRNNLYFCNNICRMFTSVLNEKGTNNTVLCSIGNSSVHSLHKDCVIREPEWSQFGTGISEKDNTHQEAQKEAIVPTFQLFQQGMATGSVWTINAKRWLEAFPVKWAEFKSSISTCFPLKQIKLLAL